MHSAGMQSLDGGEAVLAHQLPQVELGHTRSILLLILQGGGGGGGGSAAGKLMELMEAVETLKAERSVVESELKTTNPDMKEVFLTAAKDGGINEQAISATSLGRTFGPLQHQVCAVCVCMIIPFSVAQVTDSIGNQEKLLSQI